MVPDSPLEILIALAALTVLAFLPMSLAVRRDFARLGRVSMPLAMITGAAMHGYALVVFATAWIDPGTGWRALAPSGGLAAILNGWLPGFLGTVLIVLGASAIAAGRRAYVSFKRVYGLKEDELIETGIYRWSRNPQYLGYWLMFVGAGVAGASLWALAMAVLFALVMHGHIAAVEEPHLRRVFGSNYAAYCRRVSRYFGAPEKRDVIPG